MSRQVRRKDIPLLQRQGFIPAILDGCTMIEVQSTLKELDECLHGYVVPSEILRMALTAPGGDGNLHHQGLAELLKELKTWLDVLLVPLENELEVLTEKKEDTP